LPLLAVARFPIPATIFRHQEPRLSSPSSPLSPNPGRGAFVFILVMVAFDFLAFGIIAPVLPDLVRQFEGGDSLARP